MKTILVPVDFTPKTDQALAFACPLSQISGARLLLLHVWHSYLPDAAAHEADLQRKLDTTVSGLRAAGYAADGMLVPGLAAEAICAAAESQHADIVVMGGVKGGGGGLLGTVTTQVLSHCRVPVWLIPAGARWKGIHRIVFAHDFGPESPRQIHALEDFAGLFQAELYVLHVMAPDQALSADEWDQFVKTHPALFQYSPLHMQVTDAPSVTQGIATCMQETGAEVLAILGRNHGFWKGMFHHSLLQEHALYGEVPLLAFHD